MNESKIRNLEIIQNIISRMANNSFLLKGWSVTIVAGIFSISCNTIKMEIYLLIYLTIILFWALDAYYLQLERLYRVLYYSCLKEESAEFDLTIPKTSVEDKTTYAQAVLAKTELGFYFLLVLIVSIVFMRI